MTEPQHQYEVEAKPANGGWRVVKRPIGGGGGMVVAEYEAKTIADTLAGVLMALRDREIPR